MDAGKTLTINLNNERLNAHLFTILQLLLGALLVLSVMARIFGGGNVGFTPEAQAWLDAMNATGYMMPLLLITEFVAGALLLSGRWVPLALILFAPVNLNIFLLHAVLDPQPYRLVQIAFMAFAHLALAWHYRQIFATIIVALRQQTVLHSRDGSVILRTIVGSLFVITGLAKLLGLDTNPAPFIAAMQETGYLYTLLGVSETVLGLMLLTGIAVPLAWVMLAPILGNILLFHLFVDRESFLMPVSILAAVAAAFLVWRERERYRLLFSS
jgi:uncharacterized membrane protein YphA (DoxX/SURF4 family)